MEPGLLCEGRGLHTGAPARVTVRPWPGPVTLFAGGVRARIDELRVASTDRATTVEAQGGALRVATVEHLFAALAALGVRDGYALEVDGPELPLLDGGAQEWQRLLSTFPLVGVAPADPTLVVANDGKIAIGESLYTFRREGSSVAVRIDFDDPRLTPDAAWGGDVRSATDRLDFFERIAPARTFVFAKDLSSLAARGLGTAVDPKSVIVIAEDQVHCSGRPFAADEPARHKLLDLVGDLYLHGGPPRGSVHATRPGHAATHAAVAEALSRGVLAEQKC